jgi:DNA-3-methyladenine glycosylase II
VRRAELSAVRSQVERILSLDVDGSGFAEVGRRDPVIGAAQARYPGLRPVCFWSWYEAAAWAVIGQRVRMSQAAATKQRIAAERGETVLIDGVAQQAFPAPAALAELAGGPGLTGAKVERLHALAEAAQRNVFDSASLRALPREEALELLQTLPGVGPFSAELILLRGAGDPDHAPVHEPRLAKAIAHAYRLDAVPDAATFADITAGWAPYRTWATLLLRAQLEDDTHEIANAGRATS